MAIPGDAERDFAQGFRARGYTDDGQAMLKSGIPQLRFG
jgi:ribosomal protein L34